MLAVGYGSISFTATSKSALQLGADPRMRGRVMALWSVCVTGTTPIGAPIVGWVGEHVGPRWSLIVGAVAALGVGGYFRIRLSAPTGDRVPPARSPEALVGGASDDSRSRSD
jgi:MFS family permease